MLRNTPISSSLLTLLPSTFLRALVGCQEAWQSAHAGGWSPGSEARNRFLSLSCLENEESEGETEPRPKEVPTVRAREARAKSQIQTQLVKQRGARQSPEQKRSQCGINQGGSEEVVQNDAGVATVYFYRSLSMACLTIRRLKGWSP